ncbi:NUDIX hydrolase [Marinobacter zhejiangensis]|uniref:ADP-ribose pyrophosphatase YjhB, NUDIX family n=1 Tax=Marinobacter zhejiangensis TaxID=488535 RepID=A0A1I4T4G3_9GAMM|nr:NUDIX domain-containing protein [Marinobacter zhejiangensis]SFM71559.1 ADP-ribose pyrophosphatase YjhB, NUDIX family [Marinobacter zhejiangensis]
MTASDKADEQRFLEEYNPKDYLSPLVTVDVAIFTLIEGRLHVLLVKRANHPERGRWALPGGFIDAGQDTTLSEAAARKLEEKTGVTAPYLEQVYTVGDNTRDPRGWSVTVLYMALMAHAPTAAFVDSVADTRWWPLADAMGQDLAFDHRQLLDAARQRLSNKTAYTVLPVHTLDAPFTLTQLQQAFEEVLGAALEKKSFRRRILSADILDEVGEAPPPGGRGRPAALFRAKAGLGEHAFVRVVGEGK